MKDRLAVRGFLERLLLQKDDRNGFSDRESLIASGRIDSVDTLELAVFLEEHYGIDFAGHFDLDDLDSVDHIMALLCPSPSGQSEEQRIS